LWTFHELEKRQKSLGFIDFLVALSMTNDLC